MAKKTIATFHAVASGADLKRALEERKQAEARRDADIAIVREFLTDELGNRENVELREYVDAAGDALAAFERLAAWMHRP